MINNNFGIEIECTGITRRDACHTISNVLKGKIIPINGDCFLTTAIIDGRRIWKVKLDKTIKAERLIGNQIIDAEDLYKVEIVSPVLNFAKDLDVLNSVLKALKLSGAFVNDSCAIHIHVDGRGTHTPSTLCNLIDYSYKIQNDIFKIFNLNSVKWQHGIKMFDKNMIDRINLLTEKNFQDIEDIWYLNYSHRRIYFNESRYHFVNLHSFFYGIKTIEFRFFKGSLEYREILNYIKFSLTLNNAALTDNFSLIESLLKTIKCDI